MLPYTRYWRFMAPDYTPRYLFGGTPADAEMLAELSGGSVVEVEWEFVPMAHRYGIRSIGDAIARYESAKRIAHQDTYPIDRVYIPVCMVWYVLYIYCTV